MDCEPPKVVQASCFTGNSTKKAQFPSRVRGPRPNPALATKGIGIIIHLFGPSPLQILVLMKPIFRLNYLLFVTLFFIILDIRFLLSLSARIAISIVAVQFYLLGHRCFMVFFLCRCMLACVLHLFPCLSCSDCCVCFGWLKLFVLIVSVVRLFVCLAANLWL